MKRIILIILSFATMLTGIRANTLPDLPAIDNTITAGTAIVIDLETGILRAGSASAEIPSVTLTHNFASYGIIDDWNAFEATLTQMYAQLGVNAANHPVIIAETPLAKKAVREKTAEVFFNTFNVPSLYIMSKASLAIYGAGKSNGVMIQFDHDISYIAPVVSGITMPHATLTLPFGEKEFADYMKTLLQNKGYSISNNVVAAILSGLSYVASDYEAELQKPVGSISQSYTHNGQQITVVQERFKVPEALFRPAFINVNSTGIHELTHKAIMLCDVDVRKELYANMIFSGRSMLFSGIEDRMQNEVIAQASHTMAPAVIARPDRELLVWKGGKMLTSLLTQDMWLSKAEYDTQGSDIILRKLVW